MSTESADFFDQSRDQSKVKATIVAKYFDAWAHVIVAVQKRYPDKEQRLAYIDLFAGPGRYEDGTMSTPLLVLEKAVQDPKIRDRLVAIFNDKDPAYADSLGQELRRFPNVSALRFPPRVENHEVDEEIVKMFEQTRLIPTLLFADPWGYKGISLRLLHAVLRNWGCDCIFFFNYNRVNMGLQNAAVKEHMDALFGLERAEELRVVLEPLSPEGREEKIVEQLCQAIRRMGPKYVLSFRFKDEGGRRTSHHLIFVSKHLLGYKIMKDIMARESSRAGQGVPAFEFSPVDAKKTTYQSRLFPVSQPLDDLASMLLVQYAGRILTVREIYEQHSIDRPYTRKNYRDVLLQLESDGLVFTSTHRKGTMGDDVRVTFPAKQGDG